MAQHIDAIAQLAGARLTDFVSRKGQVTAAVECGIAGAIEVASAISELVEVGVFTCAPAKKYTAREKNRLILAVTYSRVTTQTFTRKEQQCGRLSSVGKNTMRKV